MRSIDWNSWSRDRRALSCSGFSVACAKRRRPQRDWATARMLQRRAPSANRRRATERQYQRIVSAPRPFADSIQTARCPNTR